jgi:uncharacterized protein DUF6527
MLHTKLAHKFVEEMPETLAPGTLYVSMRYATVLHLCCCGCGCEVVTPLSPVQWRVSFDGESITLDPSVGSWALPCRSHYVIRNGQVIQALPWTEEEVQQGHDKQKRARSTYFGTDVEEPQKSTATSAVTTPSWVRRLINLVRRGS